MKSIEITIPKKGISQGKAFPKMEANGYVGEACKEATKHFEIALGQIKETEVKPEMYATEQGVERLQEGG